MLSARIPTDISTPPCWSTGMVLTRYSMPLTATVSVPGGNCGSWKPRWKTTCPVDRDRPVWSTPLVWSYTLASTIESSRRSSCAASLLANTSDVRTVKTATTAAAAAAAASATRVRSDADRPNRGRRTSGLVAQDVPDPANRVDHPGVPFAFEFAPQVTDEHVRDVGVDVEVVTPHRFQQPLPGQHHARVLGEHRQQVELSLGEVRPFPLDEHQSPGGVDGQRSHGHGVRRPFGQIGPAQQRV